jgi:hypothetical protein
MTPKLHAKNRYHKAVTVSDEAFLWQVMTVYPKFWFSGSTKADDPSDTTATTGSVTESTISVSSGSASGVSTVSGKKKKGPNKGFTYTAGKTIKLYKQYLDSIGNSRQFDNTKLWDKKLKQIAIIREKKEEANVNPTVNTIAPVCRTDNEVFTRYAEIQMEDMNENFDEDSDENSVKAV